MALWGGRFESGASSMFKQVNDSLPFDQVMASQDIQGSISWSRAPVSYTHLTLPTNREV